MVNALHLIFVLCTASFNFFESSATLIELSHYTVITTGLVKYSSKYFSNIIISVFD